MPQRTLPVLSNSTRQSLKQAKNSPTLRRCARALLMLGALLLTAGGQNAALTTTVTKTQPSARPGQTGLTGLTLSVVAPQSARQETGVGSELGSDGSDLTAGVTLALQGAKSRFRALGFDLKLKTYDDKGSPALARRAAQAILRDPSSAVTIGSFNSEATLALALEFRAGAKLSAKRDSAPLVVPSPVDIALTGPNFHNVLRLIARNDTVAKAAGQYLERALQVKKVLLVHDASDDGSDAHTAIKQYLTRSGVKNFSELETREQNNFSAVITRLKKEAYDAVVVSFGKTAPAARLVGAIRRAGIGIPILGTYGFSDPAFAHIAGPSAAGVYYASFSAPIKTQTGKKPSEAGQDAGAGSNPYVAYASAAMPDFVKAYQKLAGRPPSAASVLGYDAAGVALQGLERAIKASKAADTRPEQAASARPGGSAFPNRATVALALHQVELEGALSGPLSFTPSGDLFRSQAYVLRFDELLTPRLLSIVSTQD